MLALGTYLVQRDRHVGNVERGEPARRLGVPAKAAHEGRDEADGQGDGEADDEEDLHPFVQLAEQALFHDPGVHGVGLAWVTVGFDV